MNLLQLRAFYAVIRAGSFTAAATRLHVSQPAVTSHVKALEDYYEVSLFRRQGRGVEPTELGEHLAEIARRLFAMEDEAVDLLQLNKSLKRGLLRLAADGPYIVVPLITMFRERFPGVRVALTINNTQAVQSTLLNERCDVTVQARKGDDDRLFALPLATYSIIVFVGQTHPWASRKEIDISELQGEAVIIREQGSTTRRTFEQACKAAGVTTEYVIETTSRETVKEAVAAGLGIGVVSSAELRDDARFTPLEVKHADLSYTEYIHCLSRRRSLRVVREFLIVADEIKKTGIIPGTI